MTDMTSTSKPPIKIYTSYFYKMRFFDETYLPVSTAVWDPKWFHDGKGNSYSFKKNGVWHGLRTQELQPGPTCEGLCHGPKECTCNSENCEFLQTYRAQLDAINFPDFLRRMITTSEKFQKMEGLAAPPSIVLLVYEAPTNPCSERGPIQQWFKDNGVNIEEF